MAARARAGRSLAGLLLLVSVADIPAAEAAPEAELWQRWLAHDPQSDQVVDHDAWDRWLQRFAFQDTDGINKVRYDQLTDESFGQLVAYIEHLESVPVSALQRDEQLAYWINLFNATTVGLILKHQPRSSITEIDTSPGFFSNGPWGEKLLTVEGAALSLGDIHHRILRPIWRDPRIHYALNCAALGCPSLALRAFRAEGLAEHLDNLAAAFVNHRRGSRVEYSRLIVSSLYVWFADDFGGGSGVIDHLRRYAVGRLAERLERVDDVDRHEFDWSLNGTGNALPPVPLSERGS